jgi:hypothetical protein
MGQRRLNLDSIFAYSSTNIMISCLQFTDILNDENPELFFDDPVLSQCVCDKFVEFFKFLLPFQMLISLLHFNRFT